MKLFPRSKSRRGNATDLSARRPVTRDGAALHVEPTEQRLFTSQERPRQKLRRDQTLGRPQTADAAPSRSSLARLSFFEAFKIQAGDDVFTFPKPQSARTIPPEIRAMASQTSSCEPSPKIGLAFGSPSHPPPGWRDSYQKQYTTTVATPTRLDIVENAYAEEQEQEQHALMTLPQTHVKKPPGWRRLGSLFRKPTKVDKSQHLHEHVDKSRPRLQRRVRTEPIGTSQGMCNDAVAAPLSRHPQSGQYLYEQGSTRSTAKMQAILGVDSLRELESAPRVVKLSSPPPPYSRPYRRREPERERELPDPPKLVSPMFENRPSSSASSKSMKIPSPAPRLELALPSYQLERYSIMFQNVLDPKPGLVDRRRSRLHMLGMPLDDSALPQKRLSRLSPILQSTAEQDLRDRRRSSPLLSPTVAMWMDSPLPPGPPPKDTPPLQSPRSPKLERPEMSPGLRPSPLQTDLQPREDTQSRMTFFDSPSSDDDDGCPFTPQTPQTGSPEYPKIRVFSDTASHHAITTTNTAVEHKDNPSTVWHSVLPPPPNSSTSSRFSVDVHKALDSPTLPLRSTSYHGQVRGTVRQAGRPAQVAVARSISVSKLRQAAVRTGTTQALRPKVIQVGAQAHSRKSSLLDTIEAPQYGVAL